MHVKSRSLAIGLFITAASLTVGASPIAPFGPAPAYAGNGERGSAAADRGTGAMGGAGLAGTSGGVTGANSSAAGVETGSATGSGAAAGVTGSETSGGVSSASRGATGVGVLGNNLPWRAHTHVSEATTH